MEVSHIIVYLFSGSSDGPKKDCKREITPWSACSVSCGMGVSIRVTNDNEDCQPVQQRRLCLVRPCELNDKHLVSTFRILGVVFLD